MNNRNKHAGNDILTQIIANKRFEVDLQKRTVSPEQLKNSLTDTTVQRSMCEALNSSPTGIIAEFKRRSPSKGWINQQATSDKIIPMYEAAGASALSILTDDKFFGGSLKDIKDVRGLTNLPIMRKDFIIDEYQLYQAKIVGADAVLLIAAALEADNCRELVQKAHRLGLEVLLEIHSESELSYINDDIDMVGVNNRNLGTFYTTIENSFKLAGLLPPGKLLVSESGISKPGIIETLRERGFQGFLIGETFMRTDNPGEALRQFITHLTSE